MAPQIVVPAEVPLDLLSRVVGSEGDVVIHPEKLVVLPLDENAARWIIYTLYQLGYMCDYAPAGS